MNSGTQILVLVVFIAITAAWLYRAGRAADAKRAALFSDREELKLAEWEQRFAQGKNLDLVRLRKSLRDLAVTLDIPAGKLRPTDRFDVELAPTKGWEADDAASVLSSLIQKRRLSGQTRALEIRTVDDYLRATAGLADS